MAERMHTQSRPRRPRTAACTVSLAALLLLALLPGAARLTAAPPTKGEDPLVARINNKELHLSDVYASIETLSLGDQIDARDQLGTYIEAMISEEVLFQWALNTDFTGDAELRQQVKDLVVRRLIDKHVRSRIEVTEAHARAYYEENPSLVRGEHVRVRRILRPERAQCEELKREIDSEEAFIAAARKHSLDAETRDSGGDVGLMMRGENPQPSYELQFFDMDVGEMRIFDVPRGCMLVRSVYYVNPPLPPFSAVKDDLMEYLRNRREVNLVDELFQRAQQYAEVERHYRGPRVDVEITIQRGRPAADTAGTAAPPAK